MTTDGNSIENTLDRGATEREQKNTEAREEGIMCGERWAANHADAEELRGMAELDARSLGSSAPGALTHLMALHESFGEFIRRAARDNEWTDYMDGYQLPFCEGVVEGARVAWSKVAGGVAGGAVR